MVTRILVLIGFAEVLSLEFNDIQLLTNKRERLHFGGLSGGLMACIFLGALALFWVVSVSQVSAGVDSSASPSGDAKLLRRLCHKRFLRLAGLPGCR